MVELTAAAISDGTDCRIHGEGYSWSVGWATDYIWADQRSYYAQFSWLKALGITTPGTYTIIATQDGTGGGLVLYVNGSSVGQPPSWDPTTFGALGTRLGVYFQYNEHAIMGDIFVAERAITSAEAGTLHDFWAAKFIN